MERSIFFGFLMKGLSHSRYLRNQGLSVRNRMLFSVKQSQSFLQLIADFTESVTHWASSKVCYSFQEFPRSIMDSKWLTHK